MLKLPADHPQNWFRNAFIHLMDCPHGNWWFYVWHRGYLGFFEQTIRALSGDETFALPYWDWTQLPQIPDAVFDGVLTPTAAAFEPYTGNLALFTSFIKEPLTKYWSTLSPAQRAQLNTRGYKTFDLMWNDVTGFDPDRTPGRHLRQHGVRHHVRRALSLARQSQARSQHDLRRLARRDPGRAPADRLLQRQCGAELHQLEDAVAQFAGRQFLGDRGPAAQQRAQLHRRRRPGRSGPVRQHDQYPLPGRSDLLPASRQHGPVVGRVDAQAEGLRPALSCRAAPISRRSPTSRSCSTSTARATRSAPQQGGRLSQHRVFEYDYEPGSGEEIIRSPPSRARSRREGRVAAREGPRARNIATVAVPRAAVQSHLADTRPRPLMAAITCPAPAGYPPRAPSTCWSTRRPTSRRRRPTAPTMRGTVAFFGPTMPGMRMPTDATFAVPLPKTLPAFTALARPKTRR